MAYAIREALSPDECLALLPGSRVGRVGVSIDALPVILPVNFMVLGESLLFRTSGASKLFRASVGSVIAFEVDGYDDAGSYGWSVLVRGIALEITEHEEVELARSLWLEAWPLGDLADRFVIIPTSILTGRRFVRAA